MSTVQDRCQKRATSRGVQLPEYIHHPLNEEIRSIGGYYKVLEEDVIDFECKKLLVTLKGAQADTACCGPGGMGFLSVAGYVTSWKSRKTDEGLPVSDIKHVTDREARKRIKVLLKQKFPYIDLVQFD
jgi:hypothetical protein